MTIETSDISIVLKEKWGIRIEGMGNQGKGNMDEKVGEEEGRRIFEKGGIWEGGGKGKRKR